MEVAIYLEGTNGNRIAQAVANVAAELEANVDIDGNGDNGGNNEGDDSEAQGELGLERQARGDRRTVALRTVVGGRATVGVHGLLPDGW